MYTDVLCRWSKYQKQVNFNVKMYPSALKNIIQFSKTPSFSHFRM